MLLRGCVYCADCGLIIPNLKRPIKGFWGPPHYLCKACLPSIPVLNWNTIGDKPNFHDADLYFIEDTHTGWKSPGALFGSELKKYWAYSRQPALDFFNYVVTTYQFG